MERTVFLALSSLLLALAPLPAMADSAWYVSLDAGTSNYKGLEVDGGPLQRVTSNGVLEIQDDSVDEAGHQFRLGGGYHVTPWLSLEAAYVRLGNATSNVQGTVSCEGSEGSGICERFHDQGQVRTSGWLAALMLQSPDWWGLSLYGRIGAFVGHTEFSADSAANGFGFTSSENTVHYTGLTYGGGIAYSVSPHLALRLGADRYPARFMNSGDLFGSSGSVYHLDEDFHVNTVSLGLVYTF